MVGGGNECDTPELIAGGWEESGKVVRESERQSSQGREGGTECVGVRHREFGSDIPGKRRTLQLQRGTSTTYYTYE